MTAVIRVDSSALRQVVPRTMDVAGRIDQILSELDAAIGPQGPCWGDDETGRSFGAVYVPAVDLVRHAFGDLREGVASIAESLRVTADNADAVDVRSADRMG